MTASSKDVLIIDKEGIIGEFLAVKISQESLVVLASQKNPFPPDDIEVQNIVYAPFAKKFPIIPDNNYSYIVVVGSKGNPELNFFSKVIKKARESNAMVIFAQRIYEANDDSIKKVLQIDPTAKVILYGDVFDKNLIHKTAFNSLVGNFLYSASRFEKIKIDNHRCLFAYLCEKHTELEFNWDFFEKVRTKRNGINYYGTPVEYNDWKEVELQFALYAKKLREEIKKRIK